MKYCVFAIVSRMGLKYQHIIGHNTLALGDTERVNEGPIVGCILTDILFALSLLKVGVAIMSHT